ncbi:hypothetical protein SESBI_12553 [Sesbania bispinosa]|nr:hypothetical protein SESBI_12553 [Sesbania bispinosa]
MRSNKIMLGGTNQSQNIEGLAHVTKGYKQHHPRKSRGWCDHYKKSRHTRDTYWFIQGKLVEMMSYHGKENRVNVADVKEPKGENTGGSFESGGW